MLTLQTPCPVLSTLAAAHVERQGSVVDAALLVGEGNASVSLSTLKVSDEGTYICTVSTGVFQAQQVIQLHVIRESPLLW